MSNNDTYTDDTEYLVVDAGGSDGKGPAVAAVLRSVAQTLEKPPENKRYDFELQVDERTVDTESE